VTGYEVLAVRYGTRVTRKAESYLNFHMYGEPDESFEMDYYFWLVRGAGRTLVVDCGFGEEPGTRRGREMLVDPVEALAGLGVDAAAVDQLVVTHAHYDHIGNLHRFPNAEIVIARREYEFWTGPYAGRFQLAQPTEPAELACLAEAGAQGRLRLVDGTLDLAPGIDLVVVGGHTPGQMVARVAGAAGNTVVLAADAVHFYEELERDRPFFIVADLPDMYRGFDVVREMCEEPGSVLVAGHDADVRRRFPERVGDLVVRVCGKEPG
jgi:glyoxylase-like metal-dependent hydrolase (beta-lactamase superfamily II)